MTYFGTDVSHYQGGLNIASLKKQGYTFIMIKCTEGTGWFSDTYNKQLAAAKSAYLYVAVYHFLHTGNIVAQVDNLEKHIGDKSLPVMLDLERSGDNPTLADAEYFKKIAAKRGIKVTLLYYPKWYWSGQYSPALTSWNIVSSSYPRQTHTYAGTLYRNEGGDSGNGWQPYGGAQPVIWQFGSVGRVNGYSGNLDVNAYRGSLPSLGAYFKSFDNKPVVVRRKATPIKVVGSNIAESIKYLYLAKRWAIAHKKLNRASRIQKVIDAAKQI